MKFTSKIYKPILSILFGVILYLFWAIPYRAALAFQEQLQLFLFDSEYMLSHLAWPGGLAAYVGEFLAQFYNNFWIGAAIAALVLVGLQLLAWRMSRHLGARNSLLAYAISFIPAALMWLYMGDINVMPTFPVAVIAAVAIALGFCRLHNPYGQLAYAALGLAIGYWALGPAILLTAALMAAKLCAGKLTPWIKIAASLAITAYALMLVWICASFAPYSMLQQWAGINYYRLPGVMPWMQAAVMLSFLVFPIISIFIGRIAMKPAAAICAGAAAFAAIIAGAALAVNRFYDPMVYDLIDYDYWVRTNNWDAIIKKSECEMRMLPIPVSATNLALGMTGQLDKQAFRFYQNGPDGLIPTFKRELNSSLVTGEIYYQLGLINTAQRFYFEAMEAIPNCNKSARCIKRLAETNLIRGNYEVAEKYLKLLQRTMFYKKWADRTMQLVREPSRIDSHPNYSRLRNQQIDDNFLYSDRELDKILGQLFMKNPGNKLATQYLLMYPLLQRDVDKFMQYLQVVQEAKPYTSPIAQQGVAFAYVKAGLDIPNGLIEPAILNQFRQFASVWTDKTRPASDLEPFNGTLWHYLINEN